jgi:hypothetical protein
VLIVALAGGDGSGGPAIIARIGTNGTPRGGSGRSSRDAEPLRSTDCDLRFGVRLKPEQKTGASGRSAVSFNSIAAILVVLQFCFGCWLVAGAFRGRSR